VVEPVDVAEAGELGVVESPSRALRVDELPLVEAVEALGHGVIVRLTAQEAVGVLVGAALPRAVRVGEVDRQSRVDAELCGRCRRGLG